MKNSISPILNCMFRSKEHIAFDQAVHINGLKVASKKVFQDISKKISSKEEAKRFVLQELDFAREGNASSLAFVDNSGFEPEEYLGALEKFQERELIEIQDIVEGYLLNVRDKDLMEMCSLDIVEMTMEAWSLGRYAREDRFQPLQEELKNMPPVLVETEETIFDNVLEEEYSLNNMEQESINAEFSTKIAKEEELIYTEDMVDDIIEEYQEVIPYVVQNMFCSGKIKLKRESFMQHMVKASSQGNSLAQVFSCFFDSNASSINYMDRESQLFLLELLNDFPKESYSSIFIDYLKKNKKYVQQLAEENNMFMQYLMGFWYSSKNIEEQLYWYEASALNGYAPAVINMGRFYDQHPQIPTNLQRAAYWYREGALLNDVKNAYYLGCMYATGEGVNQNIEMAQTWLSVAYNLANEQRKERIEEDAKVLNIELIETPNLRIDPELNPQWAELQDIYKLEEV